MSDMSLSIDHECIVSIWRIKSPSEMILVNENGLNALIIKNIDDVKRIAITRLSYGS